MINNNRQQNGRRRGRGGQRQGGGGNQGNGSRIDNRARGNAAQLLEKYKSLASEAQRQGDRVNTEYYLQFADHYFRVVSEQRGRFEEQDRQRRQPSDFDYDGDEEFGDEGEPFRAGEQQLNDGEGRQARDRDQGGAGQSGRGDGRTDGGQRRERGDWNERGERPQRRGRDEGNGRGGGQRAPQPEETVAGQHRADPPAAGEELDGRAEAVLAADAPLAPPRRQRAPRREAAPSAATDGFDPDRLPPSFSPENEAGAEPGEAARPRRRRLRPAGDTPAAG